VGRDAVVERWGVEGEPALALRPVGRAGAVTRCGVN